MRSLREILDALEHLAPARLAFDWDKIGLQVGDRNQPVTRAVVSLDRSLAAVRFARDAGAQLLLAHHPLIFAPLAKIDAASHTGRTVLELIQGGIAFVAAHTNWDAAPGGVNDALAARLGLLDVQPFGSSALVEEEKLVVYAPADEVDRILDALAEAGCGVIGAYRRCGFLSVGQGTYESSPDANPTLGAPGERSTVDEVRLEVLVPAGRHDAAERAVRRTHSYEEPAFDFVRLSPRRAHPSGRLGRLASALPFAEVLTQVDQALDTRSLAWGDPSKVIKRVAVVGGAADGEWINAQRAGADLLITGEVKQHVAVEASESGMTLLASGHYATEQPGVEALATAMQAAVPEVEWVVFAPKPGESGRPVW